MLVFTLLGQVGLSKDGAPLGRFRSRKEAALLIYLAHTGQPQQRDFLADLLWESQSTQQSLTNLRTVLTRLRKQVGDELSVTTRAVALAPPSRTQVDSVILLQTLAASGKVDSAEKAAALRSALDAYRGDFLAGFHLADAPRFNEWLMTTRELIRRQVVAAYDRLGRYALTAGDVDDGLAIARGWLQVDALHETAHSLFVQLLLQAGRTGEAEDHYDSYVEQLHTELDLEPPAKLTALIQDVRLKRALPLPRPGANRHNLPAAYDQFFGRETIRQEIHARLDQPWCRLVTLVGQGGVGKTRLAVTVARDRVSTFRDGVWLVELADVAADDDDLAEAIAVEIATALDLRLSGPATPVEQLLSHLQHKEMLLVLDNFEHLLAGVPIVLDIIRRCEHVKLLVTSREALNVRAEWTMALTGLAYPAGDADEGPSDAVDLFLARQAQQQPGRVETADLTAIRTVCRLVEGLPLAIELAAALTRHTPPPLLAGTLSAGFDALTTSLRDMPPRHRGLYVVFEMSWRTLTPALQTCLARLALFRSGFTLAAAQHVVPAGASQLADLQNKSLLAYDADADRYTMHPIIRAYAAAKRPPADLTPQKHADYFLALLAQHTEPLQKNTPQHAVAVLEPDIDNVRLAWQTALSAPHPAAGRLAAALTSLSIYYQLRGLAHEAEAVMRTTAATAAAWGEGGLGLATRAGLEQARFQTRLGRYRPAAQTIQVALARATQSGDRWAEGMGHVLWGEALWRLGEYDAARDKLRHALALGQTLDAALIVGWCRHHLGIIDDIQGRYAAAHEHLAQACAIWQAADHAQALSGSLNSIGLVRYHQGDRSAAHQAFEQALALGNQLDNRHLQGPVLNNLSIIAIEQGDYSGAQYYLLLGLQLAITTGNLTGQGEIYTNLGKTYRMLGEFDSSVESLQKGLSIAESLENRALKATAMLSLANTQNAAGDRQQAKVFYNQALAIAQQDKLQSTACEALIGMAELLGGHQAQQYSAQALALAEAIQIPQLLERARAIDRRMKDEG